MGKWSGTSNPKPSKFKRLKRSELSDSDSVVTM